MIDSTIHRIEADAAMQLSIEHFNAGHQPQADALMARAQVHATMYLAEQQRAANLIAAADYFGGVRALNDPQQDDDLPEPLRSLLYPTPPVR